MASARSPLRSLLRAYSQSGLRAGPLRRPPLPAESSARRSAMVLRTRGTQSMGPVLASSSSCYESRICLCTYREGLFNHGAISDELANEGKNTALFLLDQDIGHLLQTNFKRDLSSPIKGDEGVTLVEDITKRNLLTRSPSTNITLRSMIDVLHPESDIGTVIGVKKREDLCEPDATVLFTDIRPNLNIQLLHSTMYLAGGETRSLDELVPRLTADGGLGVRVDALDVVLDSIDEQNTHKVTSVADFVMNDVQTWIGGGMKEIVVELNFLQMVSWQQDVPEQQYQHWCWDRWRSGSERWRSHDRCGSCPWACCARRQRSLPGRHQESTDCWSPQHSCSSPHSQCN